MHVALEILGLESGECQFRCKTLLVLHIMSSGIKMQDYNLVNLGSQLNASRTVHSHTNTDATVVVVVITTAAITAAAATYTTNATIIPHSST